MLNIQNWKISFVATLWSWMKTTYELQQKSLVGFIDWLGG